jgi:RNA polymerase primary sigma factor
MRPLTSGTQSRPGSNGWSGTYEHDLVLAARADGDERTRLVEEFMPRIGHVARGYRHSPGVDPGELMQEGVVGLLRALERYDPELGTPFWPYASWWVRQAIQRLISERCSPIVLSDRALRQLARVRRARQVLVQAHAKEPTPGELAGATGMTHAHVQSLLAAERRPRALDARTGSDGEGGWTPGERLADPQAEDPFERVPGAVAAEHLPALLAALSPREHKIVRGRFGLGGPERTLRELGNELDLSAERVRQIEQEALDKLRCAS